MRWLTSLTVRTKITLGFLIVSAVAAGIGSVGIWSTNQVRQMALLMYDREVTGLRHAAQARNNVTAAGRAIRGALLATDKSQRIGEVYFMRDFIQSALHDVAGLDRYARSDEDKAAVAAALLAVQSYGDVLEGIAKELEQASMDGAPAAAIVRSQQEAVRLGDAAEAMLGGLIVEKQNTSGDLAARTDETYGSALERMLLLTAAGAVLSIVLGLALTRSLMRELGGEPANVARVANLVSRGHLAADINAGDAHPQSIIRAMANMQHALRTLVASVRESSEKLAADSRAIAVETANLSGRTEAQASDLAQTAAAMEQLAATVKSNVEDTHAASHLASPASEAAARGGRAVREVVTMMDGINASSVRIGDITTIIDGIAFQTNLLALNAAVEAARAGPHGRGFAVVASEVRSLAQKSALAARDIKSLIDESHEKVQAGTKLARAAGESMRDIVSQVNRVAELINTISVATVEQKAAIEQVNGAIASLSVATHANAASVDESARAAAQLDERAGQLVDLVCGFTLEDDESIGGATCSASNVANDALNGISIQPVPAPLLGLAA